MDRSITRLAAVIVGSVLAAGLGPAAPPVATAGSNEIRVTTTDDELNVDGDCSLREAVIAANTDTAVDACPAGAVGMSSLSASAHTTSPSPGGTRRRV